MLDAAEQSIAETLIAKAFPAGAVNRVGDRSAHVGADLPLSIFLREVRPFRICAGASEEHRISIAKRAVRGRAAAMNQQ